MRVPILPSRATYLHLVNPARRNALSLAVLRSLRTQLVGFNTSPSGELRTLPPFKPSLITSFEQEDPQYAWLLDGNVWRKEREGLPNVIVLRSEGPVFSSGHDLTELKSLSHDEVKETFVLCAEVMSLIRRSPALVVGVIQGLATAAGAQLALTTDFPIALASTKFSLPGATIGLPCTSPVTALSRRVNPALAYRMLATARSVRADQLGGAVDVVPDHQAPAEARVAEVVKRLAKGTAGQPAALSKWAFWTQLGITGEGGDGYEDAAAWAGRMMAVHARSEDAKEGIKAFLAKKKPDWKT
ncbi:enoyl-CoA hydratase [Lepidopterella palustris CBS 459.81]|uniref:Enoyl-CoA hydratase domain-containing protein 3, mitochondrial n=1 Tax=Lepidopterella palustris CBS 459.81 TaxID=1314670 RepID=A0A8E2J8P0_9PEZI|nr:enoyl-CoA hydratase [Lepidopterella palustris CBS 459.81]